MYIIAYFEHRQCFVWGFLVFSFLVFSVFKYKFTLSSNCILLNFLEAKNHYFVTKNCWKSSYICVFILPKKRRSWFHKNLHNSGMVGRRKLPDPSLNHILYVILYMSYMSSSIHSCASVPALSASSSKHSTLTMRTISLSNNAFCIYLFVFIFLYLIGFLMKFLLLS